MSFEQQEVIYYACIVCIGCIAGLLRQWRNGKYYSWRGFVSSVLSSGLFAFGSIGLWVGPDPDTVTGPFFYLAVAAFVGYYTINLQEFVQLNSNSIIKIALKRIGIQIGDPSKPEETGTESESD